MGSRLREVGWKGRRTVSAMVACGVVTAMMGVLSASASAAAPDCGTNVTPVGETAAGTFSALQSAVDAVASGSATFYLTASMTDAGDPGGLQVRSGASVTIDLGGCDLSITNPGTDSSGGGLAAIGVPSAASLTVEDTSSSVVTDQGTLTATGGAGVGVNGGSGAGIGGGAAAAALMAAVAVAAGR